MFYRRVSDLPLPTSLGSLRVILPRGRITCLLTSVKYRPPMCTDGKDREQTPLTAASPRVRCLPLPASWRCTGAVVLCRVTGRDKRETVQTLGEAEA